MRFLLVVKSVLTYYAVTFATACAILVSVPLALHYLSKQEFGLWVASSAVTSYANLFDFGVSQAAWRLFVETKDDSDPFKHGSVIQSATLLLAAIGLLVSAVVLSLLGPLGGFLDIPPAFRHDFALLTAGQLAISAVGCGTRSVSTLLLAHNRYYLVNYVQVGSTLAGLFLLWGFLRLGFGAMSFLFALIPQAAIHVLTNALFVVRLKLLPRPGRWGRPSLKIVSDLLRFGRGTFPLTVCFPLMNTLQQTLITHFSGLAAGATWSIGTKCFGMAGLLAWRPYDFSVTSFSEMLDSGDDARFRRRFREVLLFSIGLSVVAAIVLGLCNSDFVGLWTARKVAWSRTDDALLGVWLVALTLNRSTIGITVLLKNVRWTWHVVGLEMLAFLGLAFLLKPFGFSGIIIAAILSDTFSVGAFGALRCAAHYKTSAARFLWSSIGPNLWLAVPLVVGAVALSALTTGLPAVPRLLLLALAASASGSYLLYRVAIPEDLKYSLLAIIGLRARAIPE